MGAKAKTDISPIMRRVLLDGLRERARAEGKTLTEVCSDWWAEDWQAALNALARFQVRELKQEIRGAVEHKHTHTHVALQEARDRLTELLGERADSPVAPTLPN